MKTQKYLTTIQLAERWQMHKQSLADWRVRGKGPVFVKLGKKVLYALQDIELWEKENIKSSTVG